MEKKSFKKLFLGQIVLIILLILGSTAFPMDLNSEEEYENIKVLITANAGMQFSKEDSPKGRKIIYDCNLGLHTSGHVKIFDGIHPEDMSSLIIKNCFDVTVHTEEGYYNTEIKLQELKISNVTFLKLVTGCGGCSYPSAPDFKVSIANVPSLNIESFFFASKSQNLSLKLENVAIDTLDVPFDYGNSEVFNLHLKNVKVNETKPSAFYSRYENSKFILTIENSDFENVHRNAFDFKGEAIIINNNFGFLDEDAFSINTSSPFIFSGNRVKGMINPFNIAAYEVNIINNTFDSITTPWLSKIISPKNDSFGVLNITENFINHWSHNLFYLDSLNLPDFINFDGNYLNCSCKNALSVGTKFQTYIGEVFLNKQRNNFCHNFGNCPLHKALKQKSKICSGTFQCPQDQNDDDEDVPEGGTSRLKSILSILKNIDTNLEKLTSKYTST